MLIVSFPSIFSFSTPNLPSNSFSKWGNRIIGRIKILIGRKKLRGKLVIIVKVSNVIPNRKWLARGERWTVTQSLSETVVIYVFGEATRRVGVETRWAPQELAGNVPRARVDEYRRVATVPLLLEQMQSNRLQSSPIGPSILFRSISYIELEWSVTRLHI